MNRIKKIISDSIYLCGRSNKFLIFIVTGFVFNALLETLGLGLMAPFVALVSNPNYFDKYGFWLKIKNVLHIQNNIDSILFVGTLLVILFLVKNLFTIFINHKVDSFANENRSSIQQKLINCYLNMDYELYINKNSAGLVNLITNLTFNYMYHYLLPGLRLISDIILALIITLLMLVANTMVIIWILIIVSIIYVIYFSVIKKKIELASKKINENAEEIVKSASYSFMGLKEIRILNKENYFIGWLKKNADEFSEHSNKITFFNSLPRAILEFSFVVFIVLLTSYYAIKNLNPAEFITTIGLLAIASVRLAPTFTNIFSAITRMKIGLVSMEEILNALKNDVAHEPIKSFEKIKENLFFDSLELCNLNYSYPNSDNLTIKNLNFKISRGNVIGLVGQSGAGKTTLVDILLGFLTPTGGKFLINKREIVDLRSWQNICAYLPQNILLLDDTLKKNVALGIPEDEIDEERVIESLKKAQLAKIVEDLPDGLKTKLGERAIRLSGGQRQRIALARLFYFNRQFIVLDEATSALDNETEEQIVQAINILKQEHDLTIIVIAHRLNTLRYCDQIFKLENGELVDVTKKINS